MTRLPNESSSDRTLKLRKRYVSALLVLSIIYAIPGALASESGPEASSDLPTEAGPIENPISTAPPRGYQSRPCGFDMNQNGIVGEPEDCHVCDASLVGGKVLANTTDPDGDGVDEDLIYVDCNGGSNFNYCGRPGFRPCATIEFAWETVADGPEDGAEDIVCFTGTCSPDSFPFPAAFQGLPGHWTKARQGSESRDWEFPEDPAMLVGWDRDNDRSYPPHDHDDTAELDGSDSKVAFLINQFIDGNTHYELAHFVAREYGLHNTKGEGGGFLKMFATSKASSHGYLHDLSLHNINKDAGLWSSNITFNWFKSSHATHFAIINIESLNEGGFTLRGAADLEGEAIAGPWRFQNLSIKAHGCDMGRCAPNRARKTIAKLWGWVDGIEFLDSTFDANVRDWKADSVNGIYISAFTRDWDIVNNELLDWGSAIVAKGEIPDSYGGTPRYTDDIVVRANLMRNEFRDHNIFINIQGSKGNNEAIKDAWILNNIMTSSLQPEAFVRIRQGNCEGPSVTNIRLINNTLFGKAAAAIRIDEPPYETQDRFKRFKLRNNIIKGIAPADSNFEAAYSLDYLDSDFNIYDADARFQLGTSEVYSLFDWRSLSGVDSQSVACSPAFRSTPFDLRVAGSDKCAVDRGSALTYLSSSDIEGDSRPYGSAWDIGADEWNGGFFWDSFESGNLARWVQ